MGNGIRSRRRSSTKCVWAVYSIAYGIDETATGTSGSVSLTSSRYKQVAKNYTVSSSGTISLTDSVQTTAANMAVGDYLVNVSTFNNTSTTGSTLYKITKISGSSTRTITYTAYTPTLCAKGSDTGERVENTDSTAYPHNGVQDGHFYVLLRGFTTLHVWDIYNVKETTGYKQTSTTGQTYTVNQSTTIYYGNVTFDTSTGYYEFTSPSSFKYSEDGIDPLYNAGRPFFYTSTRSRTMYSNYSTVSTSGSNVVFNATKNSYATDSSVKFYSKGTSTGKTVEAIDENEYPNNNKEGDYWYVYSHSYEGYIDLT